MNEGPDRPMYVNCSNCEAFDVGAAVAEQVQRRAASLNSATDEAPRRRLISILLGDGVGANVDRLTNTIEVGCLSNDLLR